MMHYSNWLIGVKNRASLRNACKTPPDCNNRGNTVDEQNNSPLPNKKTSELMVTTHLWKKGKNVTNAASRPMSHKIIGSVLNNSACLPFFIHGRGHSVLPLLIQTTFGGAAGKIPTFSEFLVTSSGQSGGRRRAPLPRRRSAKALAS